MKGKQNIDRIYTYFIKNAKIKRISAYQKGEFYAKRFMF